MQWNRSDLSQYNSAKSPWYSISSNGKVDIGLELNPQDKLGLTNDGILKLVKDWIKESNELTKNEKAELVQLLSQKPGGFHLP